MYSLLLLNGGVGARVGADQPKQLLKVNGIPIIVYSLVAVDKIDDIDQIVLNYPTGWRDAVEEILRSYSIKTPVVLVEAGSTRHSSVSAMLPHVKNKNVIVHESARPLVTKGEFEDLIADENVNVSYMLPIPFTVAPVTPETRKVTGYLDRDQLRNVQLPQKFDKDVLQEAHRFAEREQIEFTEDATLVATAGFPVFFKDGSDRNFKITNSLDVAIATSLLHKEDNNE